MLQKEHLDRLIGWLQEVSASHDELEALVAKLANVKAEHEVATRELAQYRRELSDLKLEYQDQRGQLGRLMADIVRRSDELQSINSQIQNARQRAFGA